jgi:cytochrome c oxidase accessory protein FixG
MKKKQGLTMAFRIKRYYSYTVATLVALITPFITIDGNHIFLLSFDNKQLQLMGIAFDMQELYMLPFLLMLLFIGIFAATVMGGRVFCGWACPQTIFRVIYRDFIETTLLKMRKRINNKQKEPDYSLTKNKIKRIIAFLLWTLLALVASADFIWYFIPPEDFFNYIQNPTEHSVVMGMFLGIAAFLIYDVIVLKENFCIYVCPYSRIQSVLYDEDTMQPIYNPHRGGNIYSKEKEKLVFTQKDLAEENNECTTCEKCVTVCPTHIDIRKGMQLECINCLECVDACTTVMGKLGKESLVRWSSNNHTHGDQKIKLLRVSTYMYAGILALILGMLVFMGSEKEYMILDINKGNRLYKIKEDKSVSNSYLMLFKNTEPKKLTYKIEIVGEFAGKIEIKRFKQLSISAGKSAKDVLILLTNKDLSLQKDKDTFYKVQLRSYAIEDPKRVFVNKELTFIYPAKNKLK